MDTENESSEDNHSDPHEAFLIMFIVCFTLGLMSNIYIIHTTVSRQLKSTTQIYFAMLSFTVTVELVVMFMFVLEYEYKIMSLSEAHVDALADLSITVELVAMLFVLILCTVWFFALAGRTFKLNFKYVLVTVISLAIIYHLLVPRHLSYGSETLLEMYVQVVMYLLVSVLVIAMHCIKWCRKQQATTGRRMVHAHDFVIVVVTVYVCCWAPDWLNGSWFILGLTTEHATPIFLTPAIGCLYSFFTLMVFAYYYKYWRKRLISTLRCTTDRYQMAEEPLSESEDNYANSEVTTV